VNKRINKVVVIAILIACCIPFLFLWLWHEIMNAPMVPGI